MQMARNVTNHVSFPSTCNLNPSQKQNPTKKAYMHRVIYCINNILSIAPPQEKAILLLDRPPYLYEMVCIIPHIAFAVGYK
jgi:hypothetical protein